MERFIKILARFLCCILLLETALWSAEGNATANAAENNNVVTVFPTEISDTIHNPDMGWVLVDYAIPRRTNPVSDKNLISPGPYWQRITSYADTLPEVGNVAIVSTWAELEPNEGVYNWELLDQTMNYWVSVGKRITFRISTEPYLYSTTDGSWNYHGGAPKWLGDTYNIPCTIKNAGADIYYDQSSAIYQQKLSSFMNALAARYKNNRYLDIVDLRGYGSWGEWHSGYNSFGSYSTRETALKNTIDTWYNAWNEKKILALSCSYEFLTDMLPDCHSPSSYQQYKTWSAFNYALTKNKLTIRRDGVAGAMRKYDKQLLEDFWTSGRKLPIICEFWRGYDEYDNPSANNRSYSPETALDDILNYHPNYITLMGWDADSSADEFYTERADLIERGNKEMGYRFVLKKASFNKTVTPGATFTLRQEWVNKAVGRCYNKYPLKVYLTEADGDVVWSGTDIAFDQTAWTGENTYSVESTFTLGASVAPGTYDLKIAMVDPVTDIPKVQLAIDGKDELKRYKIGSVTVGGNANQGTVGKYMEENFSGGSFEKSLYTTWTSGTGTVVNGASNTYDGSYCVYGTGNTGTDWKEIFYSDKDKIELLPGGKYNISFDYKVISSNGTNGYFYFLARTSQGTGYDKGFTSWLGAPGQTGSRSIEITLDDFEDYCLIWGLHYGGSIAIDNIRITPLAGIGIINPVEGVERFEAGNFAATNYLPGYNNNGTISSSAGQVVNGSKSVLGYNTGSGYYEFLYSDKNKVQLEPNSTYRVSFNYKSLTAAAAGEYYYFLARTTSGGNQKDVGWVTWTGSEGEAGTKEFELKIGNHEDYFLIWGIYGGGGLCVDDVKITKKYLDFQNFESASFTATTYKPGYNNFGRLESSSDKLVNGNWSVYGYSDNTLQWYEFLYTDAAKIHLKGGRKYKVQISYRQVVAPVSGGAYYTLARTASGGISNDRGFVKWFDEVETLGMKNTRTFTYDLANYDDYYILFGCYMGGGLAIDDIKITDEQCN